MKAVAVSKGFYGSLREPGDVFEVAEGARASWFAPAGGQAKPPVSAPKKEAAPAKQNK